MKLIAITGEKQTGKTTLIQLVMEEFKDKHITVCGFINVPIINNNKLEGFDVLDLGTNQKHPLARAGLQTLIKTAKFGFYENVFKFQFNLIYSETKSKSIVLLDEIGILELKNLGWHKLVLDISSKNYKSALIVIRKSIFFELTKKYNLKYNFIIDLDSNDLNFEMLKQRIVNFLM